MPGFIDCLTEAAGQAGAAGEKAAIAEARAVYDEAYATASESLGPAEADRFAADHVMAALDAAKLREGQLRAYTMRSRVEILDAIGKFKERRGYDLDGGDGGGTGGEWFQGGTPPEGGPHAQGGMFARALELLVENKPGLAGAPFKASVAGRYLAVRGFLESHMASLIEAFESKTGLGAPRRAELRNLVREAFGEDTGDQAAKELAAGWAGAAEQARLRFNAAGGGIGKIENWGMPQHHDPLQLRRAGKAQWIADITPMLDRGRMIDRVTGLPMSEKRLTAALSEIYDTIASGGASKRAAGAGLGRGMLANARQDARFLAFKDADSWLAYQDRYGSGDPFGIMMAHLDDMSRDIARLEVLGPNPDHQFEWLKKTALNEAQREQAAGAEKAVDRARSYIETATDMMDHFTGAANVPVNSWLAKTGATVRAVLTPAALGSAIVSDVPSSPVFGAYARALSGLSTVGHMDELVRLLASPEARANARRSGFVIEQATDALAAGARDGLRLQTIGGKIDADGLNALARRMPAAVFRLSGLTGWTSARKRTFRLEFMGALADRAGKTLEQLAAGDAEDRRFAELLAAHGFSEDDWAKIGTADAWTPRAGARFLRPPEIMAVDEDLGLRVAELIETQSRQAVPETTLWTRAKLLGQLKPGTFKGEFFRSWAMFRSFTLTASHLYAEDLFLRGQGGPWAGAGAAGAAAALVGLLTVAGGISIQLRELTNGNDPRDMSNPNFWGAAAMQGGGFGILGDFLYSTESRAGKSAATTGWGPAAAAATDVIDATWGNATEIAGDVNNGDDFEAAWAKAHPGRDAAKLGARYVPWASLWWARAAWDRAVISNLQKMVDPDAEDDFARRARRLERDFGEGQWWSPGDPTPDRAPDLQRAWAPSAE